MSTASKVCGFAAIRATSGAACSGQNALRGSRAWGLRLSRALWKALLKVAQGLHSTQQGISIC